MPFESVVTGALSGKHLSYNGSYDDDVYDNDVTLVILDRLMCTKVFCVPVSRRISRVNRKPDESDTELRERSKSKPLNVPLQKEEVSLSFSIARGDSGTSYFM